MPITYPPSFTPYVLVDSETQFLVGSMVGKHNVFINTEADNPITLTLNLDTTTRANAEIIIKNSDESVNDITIAADDVAIDYPPELTLVIAPGGIGQLKRRGMTNIWDFYGFLSLAL